MSKCEAVEKVRQDIREFKAAHDLDKVIVLWTANTERLTEIREGTHDTSDNNLAALARSEAELAPSCCYAIASILERCSYSAALRRTLSFLASSISPRSTTCCW